MDRPPFENDEPVEIASGSESGFSLAKLVSDIQHRLDKDLTLRRIVPGDGRLRIDRALPFLCVYRRPVVQSDLGTAELVTTEASYLFASGDSDEHTELQKICETVLRVSKERFLGFLLLEIWSEDLSAESASSTAILHPAFRITAPDDKSIGSTLLKFEKSLQEITLSGLHAKVDTTFAKIKSPPNLKPLLSPDFSDLGFCHHVGLAVHPVYRSPDGNTLFPIVLQRLRRQLAVAIRKMLFTFTDDVVKQAPANYHVLGPSTMVKAVPLVDQQLCDVSSSFDYLLQITPINVDDAWEQFCSGGFKHRPRFYYRPLPRSPAELKQQLYTVPVNRIEDPTLAALFLEKQDELDRQISSLSDIDTPQFLYGSLQLYGNVGAKLLKLAQSLLRHPGLKHNLASEHDRPTAEWIRCDGLIHRAQEEIAFYREQDDSFHAKVTKRNDIASGIMVSRDSVLVSENARVHPGRLEALMHHEIGTHLLTYFNGRRQPLQQLFVGLAGYESFQEGIAVLAEYLVGGLSRSRIQTLAARVVAAHMMVAGEPFRNVFEWLVDDPGFGTRRAFTVATRIFRAGGSTKDAIYLRGLDEILAWITSAGKEHFERVFVGKFAASHLPAIGDLLLRGILKPPALLPRYFHGSLAQKLLFECSGKSPLELLTSPGNLT